jgi:hypothetical protein
MSTTALKTADAQSGSLTNVIINNTEYDFNVVLINPEGRFFVFRPEVIKDLTIYDAIDQFASNGYLVYDNSYDVIERPSSTVTDPTQTSSISKSYVFRGDARDILRVQITPRLNPNNASPEIDETTKNKFSINYEFAVYDIEDTMMEQPNTKLRKLYFRDLYEQIMREKNVQFSTTDLASKITPDSTDIQRLVKTGDAIKGLLQKTFPQEEGFNITFGSFDQGGTGIFFTAPTDYKAIDCLEYLLQRHVSTADNNFDKCFLRIERYPRQWGFNSLRTIFDQAYNKAQGKDAGGPLYLERFLLGGAGDADTSSNLQVTITRSPTISLYFADNNTIENFSFLPPSGEYTQKTVVGSLVHSYDIGSKAFFIDSHENDFESVQSIYQENYANNMKGANGPGVSNLVGNNLRKNRQNINNVYSTSSKSSIQRFGIGRNIALKDAVFTNKTISFRVKGGTYRQSGTFISIDRNNSLADSSFDNKLLGIYVILQVRHSFVGNDYYNDLLCAKTYNFKDDGDQTGNYM